jgi:hypothetical protein
MLFFMESKWCEKLWQAMSRVEKRRSIATSRAVERATKRQCKKDERQTEALLAKARDWSAYVFNPQSAESVTRNAPLVEECLSEARALAKSMGEKLPWLECATRRRSPLRSSRLTAQLPASALQNARVTRAAASPPCSCCGFSVEWNKDVNNPARARAVARALRRDLRAPPPPPAPSW